MVIVTEPDTVAPLAGAVIVTALLDVVDPVVDPEEFWTLTVIEVDPRALPLLE